MLEVEKWEARADEGEDRVQVSKVAPALVSLLFWLLMTSTISPNRLKAIDAPLNRLKEGLRSEKWHAKG